jgi:hypothetical protein
MTQEEKQLLADSYANAWMAVQGGTTTVEVLDHGWFVIKHSYTPLHSNKVRALKLLKGLAVLTKRIAKESHS